MISIHRSGHYRLIETRRNTKILYLDDTAFAWIEPASMGEILVASHRKHRTDCLLSAGAYYLYDVEDEPKLSDQPHLELDAGEGHWQGYLLPSGLPDEQKARVRIIPTHEVITDAVRPRGGGTAGAERRVAP